MKLQPYTEREFTAQVLKLADLRGWRVLHIRPARTNKGWRTPVQGDGKGFPDILAVRGYDLIIAELKMWKGKLTREQAAWMDAFFLLEEDKACRAFIWTPNDWEEIEHILQ